MNDYVFDLTEGIRLLIGVGVLVACIIAYYEVLPWLKRIMSSDTRVSTAGDRVADRLPATSTNGGQGIAMRGNAVNAELPGNALPEEARAIIRFQQQVEDAVRIIQSGKAGQTEAIEIIFACKRSGRPDSPYGRAHAAVQAQIKPAPVEYISDLRARVDREIIEERR